MINKPNIFCKYLNYKKNTLFFEDLDCSFLIKKFGSPLYCYSINEIKNNFTSFLNATSSFNSLIFYALKANFNNKIVSLLSKMGSGFDVVSKGEIEHCLKLGIKPKKIVFSGVGKSKEELSFALDKDIFQINIESLEELIEIEKIIEKKKVIPKTKISLRVNPDIDANTHKKISTGRLEDKFGIPYHRIISIFDRFKDSKFIKISGLAIHIGSQITDIKPFEKAFTKIRDLILLLEKKNHKISRLDLGGGIGIIYSGNKVISLKDYTEIIKKNFSKFDLQFLFEPGRSIVGSSGILVSKVIRTKKGEKNNFLIIDCGMNNLIRPSLYDSYHEIFPVKRNRKKKEKFDIVGPICESSDIFGKGRIIQPLESDELIVICSVGAYGSCMSSDYNLRLPAKEVLVDGKKIFESSNKMLDQVKPK